jgi:hypothetical protein
MVFVDPHEMPAIYEVSDLIGNYSKLNNLVYMIISISERHIMKKDLKLTKPEPSFNGEKVPKRSKMTNNKVQSYVLAFLASKDQFINNLKTDYMEFPLEEVLIGMPVSPLIGLQGDNNE